MAVVVTDNCEACRFTECVGVCPVACFHGDEQMVYIDPDVCIDCCACIPACPVQAIYLEDDLPDDKKVWLDLNRERAAVLPLVTRASEPLPTAEAKRAALGF
ncbi:MAG TPA: 4Fe-4S binding protein [Burkholderiales bacterium]|nr:4Fe-4S binding protein [Burkholderiales bacterium]